MTRTPDEIKKGLECCTAEGEFRDCDNCPYMKDIECQEETRRDALALIQQLQAENAEKDARTHQLEAERDATMRYLHGMGCDTCLHDDYDGSEPPCINCTATCDLWQWRGVQKEE